MCCLFFFKVLKTNPSAARFLIVAMFSAQGSPISTIYGILKSFFASTAISPGYDGGVTTWIKSVFLRFLKIEAIVFSNSTNVSNFVCFL